VSLLTELDAFYLDHRRCGELEAGVDGAVARMERHDGASKCRVYRQGLGMAAMTDAYTYGGSRLQRGCSDDFSSLPRRVMETLL